MLQDKVHCKPTFFMHVIFLVKPNPDKSYLQTPLDIAKFKITIDALYETFNAEHGYEANLADVAYSLKNYEDCGIKLKFTGYQATLIPFANLFIQFLLSFTTNN